MCRRTRTALNAVDSHYPAHRRGFRTGETIMLIIDSQVLAYERNHPGRLGLVKPVNHMDPAVAETIADWAATLGTIGIRLMLQRDASTDPADPGLNRVLAAAAQHNLPVNIMGTGRLEQVAQMVASNPQTQVV